MNPQSSQNQEGDEKWWKGPDSGDRVRIDPNTELVARLIADIVVRSSEAKKGELTSEWSLAKGVDKFLSIVAVLAPVLEAAVYVVSTEMGQSMGFGWSLIVVAVSALAKSVNSSTYASSRAKVKSNATQPVSSISSVISELDSDGSLEELLSLVSPRNRRMSDDR